MNPSPLISLKAKLLVGPVFGGVGALFESGNVHAWIPLLCIVAGFIGTGLFKLAEKWVDRRWKRQDDSQANLLHLNDARGQFGVRVAELAFQGQSEENSRSERAYMANMRLLEEQIVGMKAEAVCAKKEHSEEIAELKRELADERIHSDTLEAQLREG